MQPPFLNAPEDQLALVTGVSGRSVVGLNGEGMCAL